MTSIAYSGGVTTPPTQYLPRSPPPSSVVKRQPNLLPPSADSIFHQLSNHVLQHRNAHHYDRHQIQIPHVSLSNFEAFLALHGEANILKGIKLEYDSYSGHIIMCPPPTPYHDCTPYFLQSTLFALRGTPFDTPSRQRSLTVREIGFRTRDGSFMVPDAAVVVMPLDGEPRLWPTIVVEVANSQSYDDVLAKVKRWFRNSDGMVEVVLVLKFTAKDPVLDPACFLEVWRYGFHDREEVGDETVVLDGETADTGEPGDSGGNRDQHDNLANTDDAASDRSCGSVVEDSEEHGKHLADEDSLRVVGSDCESINEAEILVVNPDTCAPHHTDSDSSLSSLEDEVDIPIVHPEPDPPSSSSASSSASTSEYRPAPRPRKRHIYLAGTRIPILPVADPVERESRYLILRYSDFFGMENVPEGRAADEEVQLDLDELRLEIRLLMRMTEKMEENVKKHAAAGSGGGGKRVRR